MTAGGIPGVQVLLDNGAGAFPYDISSFARVSYSISRGRPDEQSDVTPGQLSSLLLDNTDGRFTIGSTVIASPSPIRLNNRIRIKVTPVGQATVIRHTGYIQELPVSWPTGGDNLSEVTVTTLDAQDRAQKHLIDADLSRERIMANAPQLYFPLDDIVTSVTAREISGNNLVGPLGIGGVGAAPTFGATLPNGAPAVTFAGGRGLLLNMPNFGVSPPFTVDIAFATTAGGVGTSYELGGIVNAETSLDGGSGKIAFGGTTFGPVVNDGATHTVTISNTGSGRTFYIDGVATGSAGAAGSLNGYFGIGFDYNNPSFSSFVGQIGHVAIFGTALSSAEIANLANETLLRFAGDTTSARIVRLAAYANIPTGTLDAGLTTVPATITPGQSIADAIRDVNAAEGGITFVDGSGNLAFHNRSRVAAKTAPDLTMNADVLQGDIAFLNDMAGVCNYFAPTAAGTGIAQLVRNTLSELGDGTPTNPGHGRYAQSAEYLVSTDQEALDRANWTVTKHANPTPRVPTLTIDLMMLDAATQASLLAVEPDAWLRFTNCPAQTPGGSTTVDVVVQGWKEDLSEQAWTLTLNVVSRSIFTALILDDPTYGALDSYPLYF